MPNLSTSLFIDPDIEITAEGIETSEYSVVHLRTKELAGVSLFALPLELRRLALTLNEFLGWSVKQEGFPTSQEKGEK